jgi:hypothetical protein
MVLSLALPGAAAANGNGHAYGKDKHDAADVTTTTVVDPGNGANQDCGAYCPSGVGLPSGNGNGNGNATGKPCAGCVGNADDKNPPGQFKDGSDHNNGYECDGNNGIAKTNPAHTGCASEPTTTVPPDCKHGNPHKPECTTTTTAAPKDTTTTEPATTTSVSPGVTVLGEQFKRQVDPGVAPAQAAKGLAFTGGALGKLFFTGLALALLGVVLVGHRTCARARG